MIFERPAFSRDDLFSLNFSTLENTSKLLLVLCTLETLFALFIDAMLAKLPLVLVPAFKLLLKLLGGTLLLGTDFLGCVASAFGGLFGGEGTGGSSILVKDVDFHSGLAFIFLAVDEKP